MENSRELELNILMELDKFYPACPDKKGISTIKSLAGGDERLLAATLTYLEEHALIKSGVAWSIDGQCMLSWSALKMLAKGRDFLRKDGGLTAILNAVTIKLHHETLDSLESFLSHTCPNPEDKKKWTALLKSLPADAIRRLNTKIVDLGMEKAPAAVFRLIQTFLEQPQ